MRFGEWLRRGRVIGVGAVVAAACGAAGGTALSVPSSAVWLATATGVERRDLRTGETLARFDLPGVTRLAATADGGVWARSATRLACVAAGHPLPARIAIEATDADDVLLAADPVDGSGWATTGRGTVSHFDCDGRVLGIHPLPARFSAIAIGLDHAAWLANSSGALRIDASSSTPLPLPPAPAASTAAAIAVDTLADRLWVLRGQTVTAMAIGERAPQFASLAVDAPVRGATLDPRTGDLWLLTAGGLLVYDGDLLPVTVPGARAADLAWASALHYDGGIDAFVAAGGGALGVIARDGVALAVAAIAPADPVVATLPFDVRPQLALLQPPDEALTSVRQPPFLLQVEPLCNGVACPGLPGYIEGLVLSSAQDGMAIADPLRFDPATGRLLYIPAAPLSLGEHRYAAQVRDRFGRASNVVAAQLMVVDDGRAGIVAKAGNKTPTVSLTAPANNATFAPGADVALAASAADADGTVTKVEFFRGGTTLLGTSTTAPYAYTWKNVPAGKYALTARATDNKKGTRTSTAVNVTVAAPANAAPVVTLTAPAAGTPFIAPATVNLAATASDTDGTIAKVEFFWGPQGSTPTTQIASVSAPPYATAWAGVAGGSYALVAKATDNLGAVASSAVVNITVDRAPTATLTAPPDNTSYVAGSTVSIIFDAYDSDGRIARMDVYKDGVLFSTTSPTASGGAYRFIVNWTNAIAGAYTFTGKATDNLGAETMTAPIRVNVNSAADVTWLTPADGTSFAAGAPIELAVVARVRIGSVARVDFYDGNALVGSATAPPYAVTWRGAAPGAHTVSVRVIDNLGSATTSTGIGVSVDPFALNIVSPTERQDVFDPTVIVAGTFAGGTPAMIAVNGVAAVLGDGSFAAVVPVGTGETTITAVATGVAGGSVSRTVHVSRLPLAVVYRNLIDGEAVRDDNVTVRGFATAPPNSAVAINGQSAAMDAVGNFFVNAVPLAPGDNALAVVLNGPDGKTLTQTLRIRSDAVAPFKLDVSPDSGASAPHKVVLTLRNPGLLAYRKLDLNFNGSSTPFFTEPGPEVPQGEHAITLVFANPGMYALNLTLWGTGSTALYRAHRAIRVGRPEDLAAKLRGIYTGMLDRLRVGDVDAAVDAIASTVREQYRDAFVQLGPALLPAVDRLGQISAVEMADDHATLTVTRQKPDGVYAYPILFFRDSDGIWRIDGM